MTHKVLKSCRSKMATLAYDVSDVHGASSLYIKTCWQSLCRVFPTGGWSSPPTNQKCVHSLPPHQTFIASHQKSIQLNKKIISFLGTAIASVPFLFYFHTLFNTDHANFDFS